MPNAPATPSRSVRVPDEIWAALRRIADERGETITDVILRAIRQYLRAYPSGGE